MGGITVFVSIACGLLSAAGYAALAGFGTPTLRSVLMLFTAMAALLLSRTIHPLRAWLLSLAVIILVDPFSPLGAGLWFTFLAVAALLFVFLPRTGKLNWWKTLLMAQAGVVLVLLPVSAAWFQTFSPVGFLANLLAIPWVSFLVVPPVLAGLALLPFSAAMAGVLWTGAGLAATVLFTFLEFIDRFQGTLSMMAPPSLLQVFLALSGAFVLLLPRGISARWMGLFLILPLFFPPGERTRAGIRLSAGPSPAPFYFLLAALRARLVRLARSSVNSSRVTSPRIARVSRSEMALRSFWESFGSTCAPDA